MGMTARDFVERLNAIKASVKAGEALQVEPALERLTHRLRDEVGPAGLKSLLQSDGEVETSLEEELTTLTMAWMQHRGSGT